MNFATIIIMVGYFGGGEHLVVEVAKKTPQKVNYKAKCEDPEKKELYDVNCAASSSDEAEWKRRVLMEFVEGHGNIIMFYDAYRGGFCYYSDLNSVPYTILVDVAYKYAITYKCVSFLIEKEDPDDTPPPVQKKTNTYQVNSLEAKMRGVGATKQSSEIQPQKKSCVKIIRMGKICDFLFLSKPAGSEKVTIAAAKPVSYRDFISQQRQLR